MKTHDLDSQVEQAFYEIQTICSVLRLTNQTFKQNSSGLFNVNSDLFLAANNKLEALLSIQNNLQFMIEPESSNKGDLHSHLIAVLRSLDSWCSEFNYSIAKRLDQGGYVVKEASMSKLLSTKMADEVIYDALQLLEGYGYMEEYPIARLFRDSRLGPIGGGTSEILKEIIAKIIIDGKEYKPAT